MTPTFPKAIFFDFVNTIVKVNDTPIPGAVEFIKKVQASGMPVGIITEVGEDEVQQVAKKIGIEPPIVISLEKATKRKKKPYPDGLKIACERVGIYPEDAWYVGDSMADVIFAWSAGCQAIGVGMNAANNDIITGRVAWENQELSQGTKDRYKTSICKELGYKEIEFDKKLSESTIMDMRDFNALSNLYDRLKKEKQEQMVAKRAGRVF